MGETFSYIVGYQGSGVLVLGRLLPLPLGRTPTVRPRRPTGVR